MHPPIDEVKKVVKHIYELLEPGGVFMIGVVVGESAGTIERASLSWVERYFKINTSHGFRSSVELRGFKLIS